MDAFYTMEKCALELILYFLRNSYPLSKMDIQLTNCTHDIGNAISNVSSAFKKEFEFLIDQHILEFRRFDEFPGEVLPICFKIAEEPTALRSLVGCAFLLEVITFIHVNHKCYKFTDIARKSLVFYMNTKWSIIFNEPATAESFITFCKMINERFSSPVPGVENIDRLCSGTSRKESLLRIIHDCYNYYEDLDLTPEEFSFMTSLNSLEQFNDNSEETFRICTLCRQNCELLVSNSLRLHSAITRHTRESSHLLQTGTDNIPVAES